MQKTLGRQEFQLSALGAYVIVMAATLTYLLYALWPVQLATGGRLWTQLEIPGATPLNIAPELRLFLLVSIAGAAGSYVRSAVTLYGVPDDATVRRGALADDWRLHALRALAGAAIGLAFVSLIRGATQGKGVDDLSIAGVIGMVYGIGLFVAAPVTNALRDLFERLFAIAPANAHASDAAIDPADVTESVDELLQRQSVLARRFDRNPEDANVARELIDVLRRLRRFDDAAHVYDALISSHPSDEKLILEKATFYREIGDERSYRATADQAEVIIAQRSFEANVGKEITLRQIEVRDLQFFANFTWTLQPTVNVLLGKNGYGKSHLLKALVAMLQNDKATTGGFFENSGRAAMLRTDVDRDHGPATSVRTRLVFEKSFGKIPVLAIPDMRYIEKSGDSFGPPAGTVADLRSQGADQFLHDQSFESVILTFLYELSLDYATGRHASRPPVFQLIEKTVQELTGGQFAFKDIVRKDNARFEILVLTDGNESNPLPLQRASQGTLSVLSMVGLTYRFLRSLYPKVPDSEVTKQQAIVVIDEIDAHLHPAWQQKILQLFRDTFPNVQFIVTAHTPLVVAGCKEREVAVLRRSTGGFAVEVMPGHFIGATAASMYQQVFQVEDKDLTYLRLNTRLGDKERIEQNIAELESRKSRSPEQESTLRSLKDDLYYLREVVQVRAERQKSESFENQQQMLELETMNLRGEVSRLKSELDAKTTPREPKLVRLGDLIGGARDASRTVDFLRGFIAANKEQSGLVEPLVRHLSAIGEHAAAASALEALLEIEPDNLNYLKGLAVQCRALQNYKDAAAALRKALAVAPEDQGLRTALVEVQQLSGESNAT